MKLTAKARKAMSDGAKKRWAAVREGKTTVSAATRRKMSIAAKMRERRKKAMTTELLDGSQVNDTNGNGHFKDLLRSEYTRVVDEMSKLERQRIDLANALDHYVAK